MSTPVPTNTPKTVSGGTATFQFILSWAIVLVLLGLANRTRLGHVLIYYALSLMILLLVVTQYQWFANVLGPASFTAPQPPGPNNPATNPAAATTAAS